MLLTFFGMVWDETHIITDNVSISVSGIPSELIGKSGYFLIDQKLGVNILIKFILS
jgi:hypothetical protein